MLTFTNGTDNVLKIKSETNRTISIVLKMNDQLMRFMTDFENLSLQSQDTATQSLKLQKTIKQLKTQYPEATEEEMMNYLSNDELQEFIELSKATITNTKPKRELMLELAKMLGIEEELSPKELSDIFKITTTDAQNSFL